MSNSSIDIAVIDDGINERVYNIGPLKYNIEINPELKLNLGKTFNGDLTGHGTTCAAIIKKYAPETQLSSIKILNSQSHSGEKNQLIKALYWCAENGIKLVNLSLGSINFRDFIEIKNCINEVVGAGLVIVAACNNNNMYTVPASLTNVIGIKCEKEFFNNKYIFVPYAIDGIDILASGTHLLKDAFGSYSYTNSSNSFATPLITAKIYNILIKNPSLSLEEIRNYLYEGAYNYKRNNRYNPYISINADWLIVKGSKTKSINGIILDDISEVSKSFKKINKSKVKNLIYISESKIPKAIYNFLFEQKIKIWNSRFYQVNLERNLPQKTIEINIPIIVIYSYKKTSLVYKLNSIFLDNGYYSTILSTECRDIFNDCEYLPKNINIKKFLSFLCKNRNYDLLLINVKNKKIFEEIRKNIKFDIEIYTKDNIAYEVVANTSKDFVTITVSTSITNRQILSLYNDLQGYLT